MKANTTKEYYLLGSSADEETIASLRRKACKTSDGATVVYDDIDSDRATVYARYDNVGRSSITQRLHHFVRKIFATSVANVY
jgi:hypothetical protein